MADPKTTPEPEYYCLSFSSGLQARFTQVELPRFIRDKIAAFVWVDSNEEREVCERVRVKHEDPTGKTSVECLSNPLIGPVSVKTTITTRKHYRTFLAQKRSYDSKRETTARVSPALSRPTTLPDSVGFLPAYINLVVYAKASLKEREPEFTGFLTAINALVDDWEAFERRPATVALSNYAQCNTMLRWYRTRRSTLNKLSKVLDRLVTLGIGSIEESLSALKNLEQEQKATDLGFTEELSKFEGDATLTSGTMTDVLAAIANSLAPPPPKMESYKYPNNPTPSWQEDHHDPEGLLNSSSELFEKDGYLGWTKGPVFSRAQRSGSSEQIQPKNPGKAEPTEN